MAQKCLRSQSSGFVIINLKLNDRLYLAIQVGVIKDLCCNVVLLELAIRNMRTCYATIYSFLNSKFNKIVVETKGRLSSQLLLLMVLATINQRHNI